MSTRKKNHRRAPAARSQEDRREAASLDPTRTINVGITLPLATTIKLDEIARRTGESKSAVVHRAIDALPEERERPQEPWASLLSEIEKLRVKILALSRSE